MTNDPSVNGISPGLKAAALRGVSWTAGERWLVRGVQLLTLLILARLLVPSAFGVVALASACVAIIQVLADLGFASYLIRAQQLTPHLVSTAFWTSATMGLLGGAGLYLCAGSVADLYGSPALTLVLQVMSFSLIFTGLESVPAALMTRALDFKRLALREGTAVLIGAAVGVTCALAGLGALSLALQLVIQQFFATVILWVSVKFKPGFQWRQAEARNMLRFGSQFAGVQLIQQIRDQGEPFIIAAVLSPRHLGYWVVASRILNITNELFVSTLSTVATPIFARVADSRQRLENAYAQAVTVTGASVGPLFISLAAFSPAMIPILFGVQWERSGILAAVLAVGGFATALTYYDRAVYTTLDKLRVEILIVVGITVLHLSLIVVVSHWGLLAAASAIAARAWITWLVRLRVIRAAANFRTWRMQSFLRLAAAVLIAFGSLLVCRRLFDLDRLGPAALAAVSSLLVFAMAAALIARRSVLEALGTLRGALRGGGP